MRRATPQILLALSAGTVLCCGPLFAQVDARLPNDPAWRGIGQPAAVVRQLQDIGAQILKQRAAGNLRGPRLVFSGPNGTSKALAAGLLGRDLGKEVYRLDLSSVVSKYVGETEKDMSRLISAAERNDGILLLDMGDALFGARTNPSDANERPATRETSRLLQRIEAYPGILIITSNGPEFPSKLRFDHRVEFAPTARRGRPPGLR